jgi:outer membrane receptor protein involved in Fe transport
MPLSRRSTIFLSVLIFLLVTTGQSYAQTEREIKKNKIDSLVNDRIQIVGSLYELNKFTQGFEQLNEVYEKYFARSNAYIKPVILELGIKLSFALDLREETRKFLDAYYDYSPTFSSNDLNFINPQLRAFIGDYLESKNTTAIFANKHAQGIDFVHSSVVLYTREDIDRLGARNLLDLIRMTSGFAELGDSDERTFGTRGTSGTTLQDVLILMNGHRLNDLLTSTTGPDWINLNYVEQVEILKGGGSVIFGGNAFSAVINVITKTGTKKDWNSISGRLGNGNDFRDLQPKLNTYNLNYEWSKKFTNTQSLYFSGSFVYSGGSEIDYNKSRYKLVLPEQALRAADLNGKEYINKYYPSFDFVLAYNTKALQVTVNSQSSDFIYARPQSSNLWYSLDSDTLRYLRNRIDKRQFVHLEYDFLNNRQKFGKTSLVLKSGFDRFIKDIHFPVYSIGNTSNTRLLGQESRATASLEFSSSSLQKGVHSKNNYYLAGIEGIVNSWNYNYYSTIRDTMMLNKTGDYFSRKPTDARLETTASLYLLTEQHFYKDELVFTAAVRFNYNNIYSNFSEYRWGQEYSPRFALVFVPPADTTRTITYKFKASYNSAFIPPPFLFRRSDANLVQGGNQPWNQPLISQTMESGELSLHGEVGYNNKGGVLHYNLNRYINKIANQFVLSPNGRINDPQPARLSGYELDLKYKHEKPESRRINYEVFGNVSLAKENRFKETVGVNYFTALSTASFFASDSLLLYPRLYIKGGLSGIYNVGGNGKSLRKSAGGANEQSGLKQIIFGMNTQWIGPSYVSSPYAFLDNGQFIQQTISVLQENPSALVLNAHFKFSWRSISIGASGFNLTNREYFLPSASSTVLRQRAEGRMFYLNFFYNIKPD